MTLMPLGSVLLCFYKIAIKLLNEIGDFLGIALVNCSRERFLTGFN